MINTSSNFHINLTKYRTRSFMGGVAGAMLLFAAACSPSSKSSSQIDTKQVVSPTPVYGQVLVEMQNKNVESNTIKESSSAVNSNATSPVQSDLESEMLTKKIEEKKNSAYIARKKFKSALSSSDASLEEYYARIAYYKADNEWARTVLKKQNPTEKELEAVIDEIRSILSTGLENIVDELKVSSALLKELDNKMEVYNIPRRKEIDKKINGIYDSKAANALADASLALADNNIISTGFCATYVRYALENTGLIGNDEIRVYSAKDLKNYYPETGVFTQIDVKEKRDLENLPRGCVVVVQNGKSSDPAFEKHGHVYITQGGGKATSDYIQWIMDYKTDVSVFVPTIKTLYEKYIDAVNARTEFDKKVSFHNQTKYFNRYIKWAQAVIEDGNASTEMVDDLVERFKDLPKYNKVDGIQPAVKKTQELLAEVKEVYGIK